MGWISVINKLPNNMQDVLVYDGRDISVSKFRCSEKGIEWSEPYYGQDIGCPFENVSHWMPLPEPPK